VWKGYFLLPAPPFPTRHTLTAAPGRWTAGIRRFNLHSRQRYPGAGCHAPPRIATGYPKPPPPNAHSTSFRLKEQKVACSSSRVAAHHLKNANYPRGGLRPWRRPWSVLARADEPPCRRGPHPRAVFRNVSTISVGIQEWSAALLNTKRNIGVGHLQPGH
jgi:hypothetical protein